MTQAQPQTIAATNKPLFRFVILLGGGFLLFVLAFHFWIAESEFFSRYLALNAQVSAWVLRVFGTNAAAQGIELRSPEYGLQIKHGCDALQPTAFFVLAMLASPVAVAWQRRLGPIAIGVAALLLLNIVRIVTLFYAGWKAPSLFETLHGDIWQAVFIFLPLVFWIGWALHVTRKPAESTHAA